MQAMWNTSLDNAVRMDLGKAYKSIKIHSNKPNLNHLIVHHSGQLDYLNFGLHSQTEYYLNYLGLQS